MNYIWGGLIVISIIFGAINGTLDEVINAMLSSVKNAVEIALALIGVMAFWLGLVKIAQKTGLVSGFAKLISPILRLIFNELPKNSPAFSNIALNFSANALGLANAATPFGIKAMQDLKEEELKKEEQFNTNSNCYIKAKDTASNSMCIFLGMNTAGFQLVPASVIAILIATKAENPTEIILPTLIVTSLAFVCAIIIAKILAPFFKYDKCTATENTPNTKGKNKLLKRKEKTENFKGNFRGLNAKENKLKNLKKKGGF
ncbi:MAG: hypothetical protein OSJ27_04205 [Candidatus Gastranaerophilales bacterium]|nr:hypothetical protein [Candidatus Gastranaerophilales bacterium]